VRQIVDLRTAPTLQFGDRESEARYHRECRAALAEQTVRYAVAPRVTVTLWDGQRLGPGAEVRLTMFRADHGGAPWKQLAHLVFTGQVLEAAGFNDGPQAA
jgi:hypothetical protein